MKKPLPRSLENLLWVLLISVASGVWIFQKYDFAFQPAEDAAMLLRYADNLAGGHGVVFNPGGEKVDGATDFLLMVMVSGLQTVGASPEGALRFLCLAAHFLTVLVVFYTVREISGAAGWMAILSSICLAIGLGPVYAEVLFGAPVFAFFCALAWAFAIKLIQQGITRRDAFLFSSAALLAGLTRPEGVIFVCLMLLSVVLLRGIKESKALVVPWLLAFVLPGAVYFIWHWSYFGHALPNPFYVKGGGTLHFDSLKSSLATVWIILKPLTPLLLLGVIPFVGNKKSAIVLLPAAGFLAAWVLLSNEMNYMFRFQYPAIVILLMTWPLVLMQVLEGSEKIKKWIQNSGNLYAVAALLYMGVVLFYQVRLMNRFPAPQPDGRYELGHDLAAFEKYGYKMVVTEAGNLPFYSRWNCLDPWGLNSKEVAHAGIISAELLAKWNPEVIMFHDAFSPRTRNRERTGKWSEMCTVLLQYAEQNNYRLAAAWGDNENDAHWYFVRPGFEHSDSLFSLFRNRQYISFTTGQPCTNFALPAGDSGK